MLELNYPLDARIGMKFDHEIEMNLLIDIVSIYWNILGGKRKVLEIRANISSLDLDVCTTIYCMMLMIMNKLEIFCCIFVRT